MSQFAEPVIPDKSAAGGRDPESTIPFALYMPRNFRYKVKICTLE
jgi:hypothetical protein